MTSDRVSTKFAPASALIVLLLSSGCGAGVSSVTVDESAAQLERCIAWRDSLPTVSKADTTGTILAVEEAVAVYEAACGDVVNDA